MGLAEMVEGITVGLATRLDGNGNPVKTTSTGRTITEDWLKEPTADDIETLGELMKRCGLEHWWRLVMCGGASLTKTEADAIVAKLTPAEKVDAAVRIWMEKMNEGSN